MKNVILFLLGCLAAPTMTAPGAGRGLMTVGYVAIPQAATGRPQTVFKEEVLGEQSLAAYRMKPRGNYYDYDNDYVVSPDGTRVAWPDLQEGRWVALVNGVPDGAPYDEVRSFCFSPDSRHSAYWARRGKTWTVVVDGKERGECSDFGFFRFSPDSAHYAYVAKQSGKSRIVSDLLEGPLFDDVSFSTYQKFSPIHQRLAYAARTGKSWVILTDGKTVARSDHRLEVLGFTPYEESVIFTEDKDDRFGKLRVVIGSQSGPWFHAISSSVAFGQSDEHYAYAGADIDSKRLFANDLDQAHGRVLVDGQPGKTYLSSVFKIGVDLFGGIESGVRDFSAQMYGVSTPAISPDGRHTAYAARLGGKGLAACFAHPQTCDQFGIILDGQALSDGQNVDSFDAIPCAPAFDSDGGLYYGGIREGAFFLVTPKTGRPEKFALTGKREPREYFCRTAFHPGGHSTVELHWADEKGAVRRGIIFVDGRPTPEQTIGHRLDIQFAEERFHTAYTVDWRGKTANGSQPHRSYVVLDGMEGKSYDQILGPMFETRTHFTGPGEVTYVARNGSTLVRVTQSCESSPE